MGVLWCACGDLGCMGTVPGWETNPEVQVSYDTISQVDHLAAAFVSDFRGTSLYANVGILGPAQLTHPEEAIPI